MAAYTAEDGNNYAPEIQYKLYKPKLEKYVNVSLDCAIGKTVGMTEVCPVTNKVTIWLVKLNSETGELID